MCGIAGFVAKGPAHINLNKIADIAFATEQARGGHAYGWAWLDDRGILRSYRAPGKLFEHASDLTMLAGAKAAIIHLRWATHGSVNHNINNHPHACDGGWVIHNGVVRQYDYKCRGVALSSNCDSELIARLAENHPAADLTDRLAGAVDELSADPAPLAVMGLWKDRLVAIRAGYPLAMTSQREGSYLASLESHLPGKPRSLKDDSVLNFTFAFSKKDSSHDQNQNPSLRPQQHRPDATAKPTNGTANGHAHDRAAAICIPAPAAATGERTVLRRQHHANCHAAFCRCPIIA